MRLVTSASRYVQPLLSELAWRWDRLRYRGTLWRFFPRWLLPNLVLVLVASVLVLARRGSLGGMLLLLPAVRERPRPGTADVRARAGAGDGPPHLPGAPPTPAPRRGSALLASGRPERGALAPAPTPAFQDMPAPRPWEVPLPLGLGVSWTLATSVGYLLFLAVELPWSQWGSAEIYSV